jgi:hypothetical protein
MDLTVAIIKAFIIAIYQRNGVIFIGKENTVNEGTNR